jgi:hypothetical protein
VRKDKNGGEICNFLACDDGYVYGHVENCERENRSPISIEMLGTPSEAAFVDHIDVIWTATA